MQNLIAKCIGTMIAQAPSQKLHHNSINNVFFSPNITIYTIFLIFSDLL